ncbi:MAG: HyaD/HybD family hydrogenase maturation endopeptidase [Desulfobulbales bacterium]
MDILVLGIGNVLLTDEGIGVRVLKELERRYSFPVNVELLDGGTAGIELLRHISNRDCLIIIDAMKCDQEPGTVMRLTGNDVPAAFRTRISPHQLGLSDLLAAAMLTDELPKELILFGVEPESIDIGLDLTDTVEASVDKLLDAVVDELRSHGCSLVPIEATFTQKARFWDTV